LIPSRAFTRGDEIDRNQTTQFVKLLHHMAIKARCSVAILAHPSNAGMATGSGLSGSIGWHNKVRSRAYIRAPATAKGEEIDSDVREIQFPKNNYGRQGDSIQIRWDAGIFVLENAPGSLEKIARDTNDDDRFLELLAKYDGQGRKMSHKVAANDYAPRVFAVEKNGQPQAIRARNGTPIRGQENPCPIQSYGPPSKQMSRLVLGPLEALNER
jgi:RecA-family ATPase